MADTELQRNCQQLQQQLLAQGISLPLHAAQSRLAEQMEQNYEASSSCYESRCSSPTTQQVGGLAVVGQEGLLAAKTISQTSEDAELIELIREYRCIWDTSCRSFKETPKKQQAWKEIARKLEQDGMTAI